MLLRRLWLTDFRNWRSCDLAFAPGLTVVVGPNGSGKTSLLEAVSYLATLSSFRGAPAEALVRAGCESAVVRAEGERDGRDVLIEAEIAAAGGRGSRVLVNRRPLRRARDLLGALRVSVFSPDDLTLVKGGPAERRRFLDELLVAMRPAADALQSDVERILRQRAALLRSCGGRLDATAASTLDVWDERLAGAGEALASAREEAVAALGPEVAKAYSQIASYGGDVTLAYRRSWEGPLAAALAAARDADVRRGVTSAGPHRDELEIALAALPARTHSSQGEQRSLALALRLAAHRLVTDRAGSAPPLLLDDVFSELDEAHARALLAHLPPGQAVLTTATGPPPGAHAEHTVRVDEGRLA